MDSTGGGGMGRPGGDDGLAALEAELLRLRPAAPSPAVRERVAAALARPAACEPAAPAPRREPWGRLRTAAAGIAALALAAAGLTARLRGQARQPPGSGEAAALAGGEPVAAAPMPAAQPESAGAPGASPAPVPARLAGSIVVGQDDLGPRLLGDGTPVRVVRVRLVDHVRWQDRRRNVTMAVTRPRDAVAWVPMRVD
jgi:hypothetical protein